MEFYKEDSTKPLNDRGRARGGSLLAVAQLAGIFNSAFCSKQSRAGAAGAEAAVEWSHAISCSHDRSLARASLTSFGAVAPVFSLEKRSLIDEARPPGRPPALFFKNPDPVSADQLKGFLSKCTSVGCNPGESIKVEMSTLLSLSKYPDFEKGPNHTIKIKTVGPPPSGREPYIPRFVLRLKRVHLITNRRFPTYPQRCAETYRVLVSLLSVAEGMDITVEIFPSLTVSPDEMSGALTDFDELKHKIARWYLDFNVMVSAAESLVKNRDLFMDATETSSVRVREALSYTAFLFAVFVEQLPVPPSMVNFPRPHCDPEPEYFGPTV